MATYWMQHFLQQMQYILRQSGALADFTEAARVYLRDNPTATVADLSASATGFSRGGVTAIVFAQMLNERGLVLPDGTVVAPPGVRVSGLAPIDPVATGIHGDLSIPSNVEGPILVVRAMTSFAPISEPLI